jgi:hypothetical protein
VLDSCETAPSVVSLRKSMESYSSLVLRGGKPVVVGGGSEKGNESGCGGGGGSTVVEQQQRQALIPQSYEVFLIDARYVVTLSCFFLWFLGSFSKYHSLFRSWFHLFCAKMELKPVFSESISYLLTDLIPTTAPITTSTNFNNNNNKNENNRFSKYEVFDIFSCSPPKGTENDNNNNINTNTNSDSGLLYTAMNLPLLNNRILLQETLPEQFEYLSSSQLVPCQQFLSSSSNNNNNDAEEDQNSIDNNDNSNPQLEYVVLPFDLGKTLFEFFDVNGASFPAESFKR